MPNIRISLKTLSQYVPIDLSPGDLAEELSFAGLEVARIDSPADQYQNIVIGEVKKRNIHPNADKLSVCEVDVGSESRCIVCGAPNVAEGQKVVVALPGANLPDNGNDHGGKSFKIKPTKIRGVQSEGMICSGFELKISDDKDGIHIVPSDVPVGTSYAEYLGKNDTYFEFEITPNRGDWLSYFGIAREIAALRNSSWMKPAISFHEGLTPIEQEAKVSILNSTLCRRYVATVVRNVKIGESPQWLKNILESAGIRTINNIVDITNFVMLETGQPLHAFDYDLLSKHEIIVRNAKEGETFKTLDGKERQLTPEMLMICDGVRPVALAGIMGGENSEIRNDTVNILLESANFLPQNVRRTSKNLGLSTESSQRFERGVDISMTLFAARRATQLLCEYAGGIAAQGTIDVFPIATVKQVLTQSTERTNNILGTVLSDKDIREYLKRLEFEILEEEEGKTAIAVPSHRYDILSEIDLVEEIARLYGYNNIETKHRAEFTFALPAAGESFEDELKDHLSGAGFNEILTFSMNDPSFSSMGFAPRMHPVSVLNPLGKELSHMRNSLIPGGIASIRANIARGNRNLRLFEIGSTFSTSTELTPTSLSNISEKRLLLLALTGYDQPIGYGNNNRPVDIFDMKGVVDSLLRKYTLDKYSLNCYDSESALSEYQLSIEIHGVTSGRIIELTSDQLTDYEIDQKIIFCELEIEPLKKGSLREKKYIAPSKFPDVTRDLAFIVENSTSNNQVMKAIWDSKIAELRDVVLFDAYSGNQVEAGKKSLAYTVTLNSDRGTMIEEEVQKKIGFIVKNVERECGAVLRSTG